MAEKYKSKYTGKQIDALLDRSAQSLIDTDKQTILAEAKQNVTQKVEEANAWGEF